MAEINIEEDLAYIATENNQINENYTSIIDDSTVNYTYSKFMSNVDELVSKYSGRVEKIIIGKTVFQRDIPCLVVGNKNASKKMLILGNSHAREIHNTMILMKQIEFYAENWDNYYNGEKIADTFSDAAIFYVPMHNPDGTEIVINGFNGIPAAYRTEALMNNLKVAIETRVKSKNLAYPGDVDSGWFNGVNLQDYTFREQDLTMWKSNGNGVDLHNNFYEVGLNDLDQKEWKDLNPSTPPTFSTEDYIGASGFSEPENVAIKNLIDTYKITECAITYHGRGPIYIYNYRLPYDTYIRNTAIIEDIAQLTKVSYIDDDNNSSVGFVGWYLKKYPQAFSANFETGWGEYPFDFNTFERIRSNPVDACPIKIEQYSYVWESQKYTPLYIMQTYIIDKNKKFPLSKINTGKYTRTDDVTEAFASLRKVIPRFMSVSKFMENKEYINPVDFGADPTGKVGCDDILRTCFLFGKPVRLDGKFLLTKPLVLYDNYKLYGSGKCNTKIYMEGGKNNSILNLQGNNITVEGIDLVYKESYASIQSGQNAIFFNTNNNCKIDLRVSQCYRGALLYTNDNFYIKNCDITLEVNGFKYNAVSFKGGSTHVHNNNKIRLLIDNNKSAPYNDYLGVCMDYPVWIENFRNSDIALYVKDIECSKNIVYIKSTVNCTVNAYIAAIKMTPAVSGNGILTFNSSTCTVDVTETDLEINTDLAEYTVYPITLLSGSQIEFEGVFTSNITKTRGIMDNLFYVASDCLFKPGFKISTSLNTRSFSDNLSMDYPRLTTTERNALPSKFSGMYVFDITLGKVVVWNGASWVNKNGSALT